MAFTNKNILQRSHWKYDNFNLATVYLQSMFWQNLDYIFLIEKSRQYVNYGVF